MGGWGGGGRLRHGKGTTDCARSFGKFSFAFWGARREEPSARPCGDLKSRDGTGRKDMGTVLKHEYRVEVILRKSAMLNLLIAEAPTIAANSC